MTQSIRLLARTPNGDAAFVRAPDGALKLLCADRSRPATEDELARAIRSLDFETVDSDHADWEDVQQVLNEAAAAWRRVVPPLGIETYSVQTVAKILDHAERVGGDQSALALTLLNGCPAAKDPTVFKRITKLLEPRPARVPGPRRAQAAAAFERLSLKLAA